MRQMGGQYPWSAVYEAAMFAPANEFTEKSATAQAALFERLIESEIGEDEQRDLQDAISSLQVLRDNVNE
jgi:hypothetical protein